MPLNFRKMRVVLYGQAKGCALMPNNNIMTDNRDAANYIASIAPRILHLVKQQLAALPMMNAFKRLAESPEPVYQNYYASWSGDSVHTVGTDPPQKEQELRSWSGEAPTSAVECASKHDPETPEKSCPWCNHQNFGHFMKNGSQFYAERIEVIEEQTAPGWEVEEDIYEGPVIDVEEIASKVVKFIPEEDFEKTRMQYILPGGLPSNRPTIEGKRRHQSRASRNKKHEKHMDRMPRNIETLIVVSLQSQMNHNNFAKRPRSQQAGRQIVEANFQTDHTALPSYARDKNIFVTAKHGFQGPDDPKYLLASWAQVLSEDVQMGLYKAMVDLEAADPKIHEKTSNRDKKGQSHYAVWQIRSTTGTPRLTADTRNQPARVREPLKKLLNILKYQVCPVIFRLLQKYDPKVLKRQQRAADYVRSHPTLMAELEKMPWVDFGGVFFAVAVKRGGSQLLHIDWNDHKSTYAWIIPVGPGWTGGELCLPQLGKKLPTYPRQIIAFRARYLAHKAAPCEGDRVVFTGFTDYVLMGKALEKDAETVSPDATKSH